jgi:uncharacterized damage-inducible protein DinB
MTRAQFIQALLVADTHVRGLGKASEEQQLLIQRAAQYADEVQQSGAAPWDKEESKKTVRRPLQELVAWCSKHMRSNATTRPLLP